MDLQYVCCILSQQHAHCTFHALSLAAGTSDMECALRPCRLGGSSGALVVFNYMRVEVPCTLLCCAATSALLACRAVLTSVWRLHCRRARVMQQRVDSDEKVQEAIDTCPVSCIHWVRLPSSVESARGYACVFRLAAGDKLLSAMRLLVLTLVAVVSCKGVRCQGGFEMSASVQLQCRAARASV